MLAREFSLGEDFAPVSYEEWRKAVEADLAGAPFERKLVTHTYEGIDIRPLYTPDDRPAGNATEGLPGTPPFVRGARPAGNVADGWQMLPEHAHPILGSTNAAILADLNNGAGGLLLRLDAAGRHGYDADAPEAAALAARDGVMIYTLEDLDAALRGVHLAMVHVELQAGGAFLPAAALLAMLWRRRGVDPAHVRGAFNADPLAALARDGHVPATLERSYDELAVLARWTAETYPHVRSIRASTSPYHYAGATAAQDLAFALATGVEYLRELSARDVALDTACKQMQFSFSVGCNFFLAIAKLRAARRLWARVVAASGGGADAQRMRMHVRTSRRVLTHRDPWVNLLRNTVCSFAGAIGGADAITSAAFDEAIGLPDMFGRRIARNTQLILMEEAQLHRVIDAPGGSWYLETLTDQLAVKAWEVFQETERLGGMSALLRSGWVAEQIEGAFQPREKNLATRKDAITGVSEFPNLEEGSIVKEAIDHVGLARAAADRLHRVTGAARDKLAALAEQSSKTPRDPALMDALLAAVSAGASIGRMSSALAPRGEPLHIAPLNPHPYAAPFEELREASDAWRERTGQRPRVFLANFGSAAQHTPRATWSRSFFEAGGFEVISSDGFSDAQIDAAVRAFEQSDARIAVLCGADKTYAAAVPIFAPKLRAAGAKTVILAGHPGDAEASYRAAGVDRFIFIKCDVLRTLRSLLVEHGVLS